MAASCREGTTGWPNVGAQGGMSIGTVSRHDGAWRGSAEFEILKCNVTISI